MVLADAATTSAHLRSIVIVDILLLSIWSPGTCCFRRSMDYLRLNMRSTVLIGGYDTTLPPFSTLPLILASNLYGSQPRCLVICPVDGQSLKQARRKRRASLLSGLANHAPRWPGNNGETVVIFFHVRQGKLPPSISLVHRDAPLTFVRSTDPSNYIFRASISSNAGPSLTALWRPKNWSPDAPTAGRKNSPRLSAECRSSHSILRYDLPPTSATTQGGHLLNATPSLTLRSG